MNSVSLMAINDGTDQHLKTDMNCRLSGYIALRVDHRDNGHHADNGPPLDKRHVIEPMDHFITDNTHPKECHFSMKNKRKRNK